MNCDFALVGELECILGQVDQDLLQSDLVTHEHIRQDRRLPTPILFLNILEVVLNARA